MASLHTLGATSADKRNPAGQGRVRRVLLVPCEPQEANLSSLRRQVLVDRHHVDLGMTGLIAALAYGETLR